VEAAAILTGLRSRATGSEQWAVRRLNYYRRLLPAYLLRLNSQLTFWHDQPEANREAPVDHLGQYYMPFTQKANYPGPFDPRGVPLLDYRGRIGKQYNPIAIAQYGLGNYNLYCRTGSEAAQQKFILTADWLADRLEPNLFGIPVWNHYFDFEYRTTLRSPWYSGLAQGQGLSVLVRAQQHTGGGKYIQAAHHAFAAFQNSVDDGGVIWEWPDGDIWFEEYIVSPPTHILNGFIWALWGVYDYALATSVPQAKHLFQRGIASLARRLRHYDLGYWSLYELAGTRLAMISSPFYHRLHIAQLQVMQRLAEESHFGENARIWEGYLLNPWGRKRALLHKMMFKLLYY
jgi:hypothetical protein